MPRFALFRQNTRDRWIAFTLIELLTVMAIIAILAALTLAAASGVWQRVARSRASGEISAMGSSLDSYKTDNGAYPVGTMTAGSYASVLTGPPGSAYPLSPVFTANQAYQISAQALYEALSSKVNYLDTTLSTTYPATGRSYENFTPRQLGNYTTQAGNAYGATTATYVQDPWNYAYGYSTGDGNLYQNPPVNQALYPYNGQGFASGGVGNSFYDLWSTGGTTGVTTTNPTPTSNWITNWK